jgi:hypothetical protein
MLGTLENYEKSDWKSYVAHSYTHTISLFIPALDIFLAFLGLSTDVKK